jgi:dolichyl-phosphate beta-glucosyltransferase
LTREGLSVIVPAYNEAARINDTLDSIQQYLAGLGFLYEIIVIADGTDRTREIVRARASADGRLFVGGSSERRGKGRGVREGIARARGAIVGFVDADNKTSIQELEKILPWFDRGYDIVIGSRGMDDSQVQVAQPLHRRVGSRAFGTVMHMLVGLHGIRDTQCGFKFFRRAVAQHVFAEQRVDGYMFDVEVLSLAERAGYRITDVGVAWRDDGDSRLDLIGGNWDNLRDLLRIRWQHRHPVPASALERDQTFEKP